MFGFSLPERFRLPAFPKRVPLKRREAASKFLSPSWVSVVIDGKGVSCLVASQGRFLHEANSQAWDDVLRSIKSKDSLTPDAFTDYLAGEIISHCLDHRVLLNRVTRLAVSFSGCVDGDRVSSRELPVQFDNYRLAAALREAISYRALSLLGVDVALKGRPQFSGPHIEDERFAACLGEMLSPEGKLHGHERGIFVEIGEYIAATGVEHSTISAELLDLGVLMHRSETDTGYAFCLDGKAEPGCALYRLADSWIAARFASEVLSEYGHAVESFLKRTGLEYSDLDQIASLLKTHPERLLRSGLGAQIRELLSLLFTPVVATDTISALACGFKRLVYAEWADLLVSLARHKPGCRIVVGGSRIEACRSDLELRRIIAKRAAHDRVSIEISDLDSIERRALGASGGMPAPLDA